jgi:hypothetical protein
MDFKLHRPRTTCVATGRPFSAGDAMVSALVRGEGGIERRDYAVDGWGGPPEGTLAWWRSTFPADPAAGVALAPADVLLDVVEELEDGGGDDAAVIRYLVVLELLRRRAVRMVDRPGEPPGDSGPELVVACRRRHREYRVREVAAAAAAAPGVEERLAALLWTGGEA